MPRHRKQKSRNHHHLFPKSRGGQYRKENILYIDKEKHEFLHRTFGCRTLGEILVVLHRMLHAKEYTKVELCPLCNHTERVYIQKQIDRIMEVA